MKKLNKKVLIFDLDGVIFDSKTNMLFSWSKVQDIHSLKKIKFDKYFQNIGRPFYDILKIIGIKKHHKKILLTYQSESIKRINLISYYKNALKIIRLFHKKKFILNIVTSKDIKRTKFILGKNKKYFSYVECHNKKFKGKPDPYLINNLIKKLRVEKSDCIYIGDTNIDYQTAKNSKIDFMFAEWGYGKNYNYKYKCKNFLQLSKLFNF